MIPVTTAGFRSVPSAFNLAFDRSLMLLDASTAAALTQRAVIRFDR